MFQQRVQPEQTPRRRGQLIRQLLHFVGIHQQLQRQLARELAFRIAEHLLGAAIDHVDDAVAVDAMIATWSAASMKSRSCRYEAARARSERC